MATDVWGCVQEKGCEGTIPTPPRETYCISSKMADAGESMNVYIRESIAREIYNMKEKKNSNMLLVLLSDFFSSFVTFALSIILFNTSHSISDNIQITNLCFSNSLKGILFTCLVNCFSFFLGTFRVFFFSQR